MVELEARERRDKQHREVCGGRQHVPDVEATAPQRELSEDQAVHTAVEAVALGLHERLPLALSR
eukprot:7391536-Prymnesium_polylepis.1